jgi:hypothetical protein
MKLYKLTDADSYTRRGQPEAVAWIPGAPPPKLDGTELCSAGVYHAYRTPEIAVFMDSIHAAYLPGGLLWEADGDVVADDGTKVGCQSLTVHRVITPPVLPLAVRVRVAIYAVQRVMPTSQCQSWHEWAHSWLSGTDRSAKAADAAARATARAVWLAADAEARAAARATWLAAEADAEADAEAWSAEAVERATYSTGAAFTLQAYIERAIQDEERLGGNPHPGE